jgi:hypothetical protein
VRRCRERQLSARAAAYGGHERSVPDVKGCIPEAPEGGHRTHAGTLLAGAGVAFVEAPPELPRADGFDRAPSPLDGPPPSPLVLPFDPMPVVRLDPVLVIPADLVAAAPPIVGAAVVVELPDVGPLGVVPVVALAVDCPGMAGLGDVTVELGAALPSETTPLLVMLAGVVTVCAKAGPATSEKNTA